MTIYPDKDYNSFWISARDDEDTAQSGGNEFSSSFCVQNLTIDCCPLNAEYHTTEKIIFPNSTTTQHDPLPVYTQVKNNILAIADNGDIIVASDDIVNFRAGNEIQITATGGNSFHVENGGFFNAKIEDCLCSSTGNDVCVNYIPPGPSNVGGFEDIFVPSGFDPSGNIMPGNENFIIFYGASYPMPYNAYRAEFRIFSGAGDLFHEQIIDDKCNGIPEGSLYWDGCVGNLSAAIDTYVWTLELINCDTSVVLSGDVTMVSLASCP